MPRPRTLDAHPREFFAFTEELLTQPARTIPCGEGAIGSRRAQSLRSGMYHFWSRFRKTVEDFGFRPEEMNLLAWRLKAAGKLPDHADGALIRAMFRIAANTALSLECTQSAGGPAEWSVRFLSKSSTALAALLAENMATPTEPAVASAGLLALLNETKLD